MTTDIEAIIATAKSMREQLGDNYPKPSLLALWFETADALEAVAAERDLFKREQVRLAARCDAAQREHDALRAELDALRSAR